MKQELLWKGSLYVEKKENRQKCPIGFGLITTIVGCVKIKVDRCECGCEMESLGVNHYMTRDTIYGDWSCTTYNSDTGEEIGGFCADAGLVSVFLLEEILKYNPEFDYHTEKPWTTTLIKDFKGIVQFVVKRTEGIYEDTTEYHKKGDTWTVDNIEVIGHGINKLTGEPINFVGKQTGF